MATAPEILFAEALARQGAGDPAGALDRYLRLIVLLPDDAAVLLNAAFAWRALGRHGVAERFARRARLLAPLLAETHLACGDSAGALVLQPDGAAFVNAIAIELARTDPQAALPWYRRAIHLAPGHPEPLANLAASALAAGHVEDALAAGRRALLLAPGNAEGWNNLGNALFERRDYPQALAVFGRARRLSPDFADACINEGGLRLDLGQADEGGRVSRLAVVLAPHLPGAYNNLANGLLLACRLEEAGAAFRRALLLAPDDAQIHFNYAAVLLKQGRMDAGWAEYEWRRKTPAALRRAQAFNPPDWPGGDPAGKTLLLSVEQGLGDGLQFCRYASWLAGQGAKVLLRTNPPLVRLMRSLRGVEQVFALDDPLPPFDFHLPLMSVPSRYGEVVTESPYLFADPTARERWRRRLVALPGKKIGLVWSGDPRPGQRSAHLLDRRRSLRLDQLAELADVPGISWISLQKGPAADQARHPPAGLALTDWTEDLDDFADSAALIDALDLVITVDTSVAHLAGALGKSVWILSRFDGCWRWRQGRDDTPWYPSARLFRQRSPGDWREPLGKLLSELGG